MSKISKDFIDAVHTFESSEQDYFHELMPLVRIFQPGLRSLVNDEQLLNEIFLNIEAVAAFHAKLLAQLSEWNENALTKKTSFKPIIDTINEGFSVFSDYFVNSGIAAERCDQLIEKQSSVSKFLEKNAAYGKISTLLMLPVTRVSKYPAYLKKLARSAPKEQQQKKDLSALAASFETWVERNRAKGRIDADEFRKLTLLQQRLTGITVVVPGRVFIHESPVTMLAPDSKDWKERRLFLFSDCVMYATTKKFAKSKCVFEGSISVDLNTSVHDLDDSDVPSGRHGFRLVKSSNLLTSSMKKKMIDLSALDSSTNYNFSVKKVEDRDAWISFIESVIQTQQKGSRIGPTSSPSSPSPSSDSPATAAATAPPATAAAALPKRDDDPSSPLSMSSSSSPHHNDSGGVRKKSSVRSAGSLKSESPLSKSPNRKGAGRTRKSSVQPRSSLALSRSASNRTEAEAATSSSMDLLRLELTLKEMTESRDQARARVAKLEQQLDSQARQHAAEIAALNEKIQSLITQNPLYTTDPLSLGASLPDGSSVVTEILKEINSISLSLKQ